MGRRQPSPSPAPELTWLKPGSPGQRDLVKSIRSNPLTIVTGPAGSGKTALSIQTLLELLRANTLDRIIVVRLTTPFTDENIGALPGDLSEKLSVFAGPVVDSLSQIIPQGEIDYLFAHKKIEVLPVCFLRGRSFCRTGILVDEVQHMTQRSVLMILTRLGLDSRMVLCGDKSQADFIGRDGISYALRLAEGISEGIGRIVLNKTEVYRHWLIPILLEAAERLDNA